MDASVRAREAEKAVSRMEDAEAVLREYNYDKAKLVPILQAVQARYNWLSKELLSYIACALGLPPARVYAHFSLKPKGKNIIRLCDGTACHVKGSTAILDALYEKLNIKPDRDSTDDMMFTVETVSCLGACGLAPVMLVNDDVHGQVKPSDIPKIIDDLLAKQGSKTANEVA